MSSHVAVISGRSLPLVENQLVQHLTSCWHPFGTRASLAPAQSTRRLLSSGPVVLEMCYSSSEELRPTRGPASGLRQTDRTLDIVWWAAQRGGNPQAVVTSDQNHTARPQATKHFWIEWGKEILQTVKISWRTRRVVWATSCDDFILCARVCAKF